MNTAMLQDAVRPAALIERRKRSKKRAQFWRDVVISVGYLLVTHVLLPVLLVIVLLSLHWGRTVADWAVPVALTLGVAWGFEAKDEPVKIAWQFPNKVELYPGREWVLCERELVWRFRRWRHLNIWLGTFVAAVISLGALLTDLLPAVGACAVLWLRWALKRLSKTKTKHEPPYGIVRVRAAMYATGLWGKDTKNLPAFRHVRPMKSDDYSHTIWVSLHGVPYKDLSERVHKLKAGFRNLRENEVVVDHPEDLAVDAVRLRFLTGMPKPPKEHYALTAAKEAL